MPLIEFDRVSKIFGPRPGAILPRVAAREDKAAVLAATGHTIGLGEVTLTIEPAEVFVVMGLSGSGKSTLLRHVNRLIDPTAGAVRVGGTDLSTLRPRALNAFRRETMGMVFQHFGLMPHKSVRDNIAYGLAVQGLDRRRRHARAEDWIAAVGLEGYETAYPAALSGGMQQRVGLARALCTNPQILLMDEPFSALDPLFRSQMQDMLSGLQQRLKKTILFITHDFTEALRLADRIAVLREGRLVQVGTPAEIVRDPADAYVRAFVSDVNRTRNLALDAITRSEAALSDTASAEGGAPPAPTARTGPARRP